MDKSEKMLVAVCVCVLIVLSAIGLLEPYFQAKLFNKFSEKKATYWDAVFLKLRVEAK